MPRSERKTSEVLEGCLVDRSARPLGNGGEGAFELAVKVCSALIGDHTAVNVALMARHISSNRGSE